MSPWQQWWQLCAAEALLQEVMAGAGAGSGSAFPWQSTVLLGGCVAFLQRSVLQHPKGSTEVPCLLSGTTEPPCRPVPGHSQCWHQTWGCLKWAVPKAGLWQCIPALLQAGQGAPSRENGTASRHLLCLIEFGRLFFMAYFNFWVFLGSYLTGKVNWRREAVLV